MKQIKYVLHNLLGSVHSSEDEEENESENTKNGGMLLTMSKTMLSATPEPQTVVINEEAEMIYDHMSEGDIKETTTTISTPTEMDKLMIMLNNLDPDDTDREEEDTA